MKLSNKAAIISILLISLVCCVLFISNCTRGNKIDRLEQNEIINIKRLEQKLQRNETAILLYKNRVDSLFRARSYIDKQIDSISRCNAERIVLLQSYEQQIFKLKKQINEKRNWSDSSIHTINGILPN